MTYAPSLDPLTSSSSSEKEGRSARAVAGTALGGAIFVRPALPLWKPPNGTVAAAAGLVGTPLPRLLLPPGAFEAEGGATRLVISPSARRGRAAGPLMI